MAEQSIIRTTAALLVVVVLLGSGVFWLTSYKPRQARHDVDQVLNGLAFYLREQDAYPTGTTAEICQLLLGHSVKGQNPRHLSYIEATPREINAQGQFVDPWGNPYRILIDFTPYVYSCGHNQVDEQGGGDDIAAGTRPRNSESR